MASRKIMLRTFGVAVPLLGLAGSLLWTSHGFPSELLEGTTGTALAQGKAAAARLREASGRHVEAWLAELQSKSSCLWQDTHAGVTELTSIFWQKAQAWIMGLAAGCSELAERAQELVSTSGSALGRVVSSSTQLRAQLAASSAVASMETSAKELAAFMLAHVKEAVVGVIILGCLSAMFLFRRRRSRPCPGPAKAQAEVKEPAGAVDAKALRAPTPARRRSASPGLKAFTAEESLKTLNEGTFEDLVGIRGIGDASALKILKYRENGGHLSTLDELSTKVGLQKRFVNMVADPGN